MTLPVNLRDCQARICPFRVTLPAAESCAKLVCVCNLDYAPKLRWRNDLEDLEALRLGRLTQGQVAHMLVRRFCRKMAMLVRNFIFWLSTKRSITDSIARRGMKHGFARRFVAGETLA